MPTAEKDATPLDYLRRLQAEAEKGFHRDLRAWVDDNSSVARVLHDYAARVIPPGEGNADLREVMARVWDECTDAHHEYAVRQGLAFAHPPNPYRVIPPGEGN